MLRPVPGHGQSLVEQRLVRDDAAALDAARRRQHHPGGGVVDPQGQLGRCESAEDDRVDRADPGAGQHPHHGLGHHRHVEDDPVAGADAEPGQSPGEPCDLRQQPLVRVRGHGAGDRAVVDQGQAFAPAGGHVAVQRVVAGVEDAVGEPPVERRPRPVQHLLGGRTQSTARAASPQKPSGSVRLRRYASV